jgi:hypothetical protein
MAVDQRRPAKSPLYPKVSDGTRTRDRLDHDEPIKPGRA